MPPREDRKPASCITAGAPTIPTLPSGFAGWPRASCAVAQRRDRAAGGDWRLICAWPYGDIYVLEAIWKQLGIDAIVRQQAGTRHLGFDVERALFALVANRACAPASKLYCHEQWLKEDAHIAGTQALKLHQIYRVMDFLKRTRKPSRAIFHRVADRSIWTWT
ncbi:MAG: hypothetical protein IPI02_23640 [Sterolibacteriaceae bacterium]|nr:hypothetical protein [Sterolibacteriaceae bacterium]